MFEPIQKILNLQEFKKEIFNGKIFVFNQSDIALNLIQEIKNKIYQINEIESLIKNNSQNSLNIVSDFMLNY